MSQRSLLIGAALLLSSQLLGCELVADFDRSKIPVVIPDAGLSPALDAAIGEDSGADQDAGSNH